MGLFQEWLRARMYRKQVTKGIKEALEQPKQVDMSDLIPTGQKLIVLRKVIKAKKEDIDDVFDIMYEILKEDVQQVDKCSIKNQNLTKLRYILRKSLHEGKWNLHMSLNH